MTRKKEQVVKQVKKAKQIEEAKDEYVSPYRPKQIFTLKEFCEMFKFTVRHYHRHKKAGGMPKVIRAGGRVLISLEAINEWQKSCEEK